MPVDFSRASVKPLDYAAAIASEHGARILLLHVTKPISFCVDCGYGPVNRQVADAAQVRKDRARLRRSALNHLPSGAIDDVLIRSGNVSEEIIRAAEELRADLIILYAHSAIDAHSVGSHETAERVMRSAPCPVLVMRSSDNADPQQKLK